MSMAAPIEPFVCTTALGAAVVPDVNTISTGSSGSRETIGRTERRFRDRARIAIIGRPNGRGTPTVMKCRAGTDIRLGSLERRPSRYTSDVAITQPGSIRRTRPAKISGPINGLAATTTPPARTIARIDTIDSIPGGTVNNTRSPGRMPSSKRALASVSIRAWSCAKLSRRPVVSWSASAPPRSAACRSSPSSTSRTVIVGARPRAASRRE